MRLRILMLLLIVTMGATAQVTYYVGASVDPAMALWGPYHDEPHDIGTTFNAEFRIGAEKELSYRHGLRFSMAYEIHPSINYTKWAFLQIDYRLTMTDWLYGYVGVELGQIRRRNKDAWWGDPYNYREIEITRFNPGINGEIQIMLNDNIGLSSNINVFRAEQELIDEGKNVRWDVMVGIVAKI